MQPNALQSNILYRAIYQIKNWLKQETRILTDINNQIWNIEIDGKEVLSTELKYKIFVKASLVSDVNDLINYNILDKQKDKRIIELIRYEKISFIIKLKDIIISNERYIRDQIINQINLIKKKLNNPKLKEIKLKHIKNHIDKIGKFGNYIN